MKIWGTKFKLSKQDQRQHDTQQQPKQFKEKISYLDIISKQIKEKYLVPKSNQVVSASGGHTQYNIDFWKVLHFIQEIMQTFTNYSEQLHIHLNINVILQETS